MPRRKTQNSFRIDRKYLRRQPVSLPAYSDEELREYYGKLAELNVSLTMGAIHLAPAP